MKVNNSYKSLAELQIAAAKADQKVYETLVSYSFRIFDKKGMTIEINIYTKPKA